MKIQIIGAGGMLGSAVMSAVIEAGHEPVGSFYGDITSCAVLGPVMINCAGIVKQRAAQPSEFVMVNGYGPQRLAEACDGIGARLIQVSTDCVFAGECRYGHGEPDAPDGRGIYAVSKLAGEVTRAPHLTLRTSFVGFGKRGLVADLEDLVNQHHQTVRATHKALWTGHTVPTIAKLLVHLATERPDVTGLLHIPARAQTRPALIQAISDRYGLGITVETTDDPAEDRRLVSERWVTLGLPNLPPFNKQLAEMKP